MMKHVQLSPYRNRADTVSLSSNASFASLSPEPFTTTTSRSSSYTSLINEQQQQQQQQHQIYSYNNHIHNYNQNQNQNKTTIKVYARCLRPDIEYKTLSISYETTCREVVDTLLSKYRMKHRDPRLFYLSMEVLMVRQPQPSALKLKTHIALDDAAKPAVLQSCHPRGDSRFSLQTRRGGLVKVYDSLLNAHSKYKSLLISTQTTTNELIQLLLTLTTNHEQIKQFSLYEVWPATEQQRKLHPDEKPLLVQQTWPTTTSCHFIIKTNTDYRPLTRRKFPLTSKPHCQQQQQQQQQHYNNNNNNSIKNLTLFEEKRKREQERKHQNKHEHEHEDEDENEKQIKSYNSKYNNDSNQSYADYENYFYI